jgi:conjugal transfer pilus assembly protein TraE
MKTSKYNSMLKNANYTTTFWMLLFAGSGLLNLMLGWFVVTADTTEKTIITPANYTQTMWVKGDEVSNSYKDEVAKYLVDLLLTYHSQNAEAQFSSVLNYAHPSQYNILKARFGAEALRAERNQLSNIFYRLGSHVMDDSVVLTGEERRMVGTQVVATEIKSYKIEMDYQNGKMYLNGFYEVVQNPTTGEYSKVIENDGFEAMEVQSGK